MIVDDVVLVLADNIHCRKHIESVVYPALHILEVNLLPNLSPRRRMHIIGKYFAGSISLEV